MSKIMSTLVLLVVVGFTAYYSGTAIKANMAEKNLAKPVILESDTAATSTASSTLN
ncbi:MAG: hypothetical protein V4576_00485 [Patescibacteria group bacterium]